MSMLDVLNPKRRGRPPIPTNPEKAPPVAARLDETRAQLDALDAEYAAAALADALGEEGAADRLATVKAQRAALEQRVSDLETAHAAALAADRAMFAAQRAALHSTQVAAVKRHLSEREEAARRLSIAVENAVIAWRDLFAASRKTQRTAATIPGGFPDPRTCSVGEIDRMVSHELHRVGGKHNGISVSDDHPPSFPGAKPLNFVDQHPSKCPALIDEVARVNASIVATLEGRDPR